MIGKLLMNREVCRFSGLAAIIAERIRRVSGGAVGNGMSIGSYNAEPMSSTSKVSMKRADGKSTES
jgi:hypothetical protein